jgi:hypothetical protein
MRHAPPATALDGPRPSKMPCWTGKYEAGLEQQAKSNRSIRNIE